jgi:hypothetical protein
MNEDSITRIFCDADDFSKAFEANYASHLLPSGTGKAWFAAGRMSLGEVMTIVLLFHLSGYRCFKWFYQRAVQGPLPDGYFPHRVSYNRFAELMKYSLIPLAVYTQFFRRGKGTGVSFIGTAPLKACHNRRIRSHKVFSGYAERGKSSAGWF